MPVYTGYVDTKKKKLALDTKNKQENLTYRRPVFFCLFTIAHWLISNLLEIVDKKKLYSLRN